MSKKSTHAKPSQADMSPTDKTPMADDTQQPAATESAPRPLTETEQLVLDFARDPDKHARLLDPQVPLPKGLSQVLERAADAVTVVSQAFAGKGGGEQAAVDADRKLADASLLFVKRVFLAPGGDFYRVLGLNSNATTEDVHRHYRWLRRLFWREETDAGGQSAVIRISEAYVALRDPHTRRAYNEKQFGRRGAVFIGDEKVGRPLARTPTPPARVHTKPAERRGKRGAVTAAVVLLGLAGAVGYWMRQAEVNQPEIATSGDLDEPTVTEVPIEPVVDSALTEAPPVAAEVPEALTPAPTIATTESEPEPVAPTPDKDLLSRVDEFIASEPAPVTEAAPPIVEEPPVVASIPPQVPLAPVEPDSVIEEAPVVDPKVQQITALLAAAETQVENSLLTQPPGNNAFETYQNVLAIDPTNADARAGILAIADRYVGLTRYRLQRDRFDEALEMADKGLAVSPDHDQLLALKALAEEGVAAKQVAEQASPPVSAPIMTLPPEATVEPQAVIEAATPTQQSAEADTGIAVIPVLPQTPTAAVPAAPIVEQVAQPATVAPAPAATVRPESPPVQVASVPPVTGLTDFVLQDLVKTFVTRYEAGDLDSFMALFAEDVRTNNRVSKSGVRGDYASLFSTTDSRLMRLRDVRWSRDADMAIGEGDFSLNIIKSGETRPRSFEGSLTFQVYLVDGEPKIRGLYHAQRKIAR